MAIEELEQARADGAQPGSRPGADALAESLRKCGVEYVFGYMGGCVPETQRSIIEHGIPTVAGRNELAAAWMSYGYNRVSNRAASAAIAWCVGAMHASPVVHAAKLDSTPLLFLTMESAPGWDTRDILQHAADLHPALRPISKYIQKLVVAEDVPVAVRQAVLAASTGKFGPAVLNLTQTAMVQPTSMVSEELTLPARPAAAERDLDAVMDLIRQASRPVLLVGAGVQMSGAVQELRAFAQRTGIPVVSSSFGGRGVLGDDNPLYAGGGRSVPWAGPAIRDEADLWIAVGYGFSQNSTASWTGPRPSKVIHVDIEENQIGRIFQPTVGIVADAKEFLTQMLARVESEGLAARDASTDQRLDEIAAIKQAAMRELRALVGGEQLISQAVGATMAEVLPDDTLVVGDEGGIPRGMIFPEAKYPNGFSNPIGNHYMSLGSAIPVAVGAKLARPERPVAVYTGDAGFYYACAELSVLAEHNLKIPVIVDNNGGPYGGPSARDGGAGPVQLIGPSPWFEFPGSTDFAAVARGFGVESECVENPADLLPALRRAVEADGPYVVEVKTDGLASYRNPAATPATKLVPTGRQRKVGHLDLTVEGSWPS